MGGYARGVMVKAMKLRNRSKRVRTPVALFTFTFEQIPLGKAMNPLILPDMGLMVPLLFWRMALALNDLPKVDMPLNKETKPNHQV